MKISSTKFIKGIVGNDELFLDGIPQIAFIGRSNVGKSSLINAITNSGVAHASSFPGRTQEINIFLVNNAFYFVDLPGYGFSRISGLGKEKINDLIEMYLFHPDYDQKYVVLIIDANVGMTDKDTSMLQELEEHGKNIVIALSKIDKMTQSEYHHKLQEIKIATGAHPVFPVSAKKRKGTEKLVKFLLT